VLRFDVEEKTVEVQFCLHKLLKISNSFEPTWQSPAGARCPPLLYCLQEHVSKLKSDLTLRHCLRELVSKLKSALTLLHALTKERFWTWPFITGKEPVSEDDDKAVLAQLENEIAKKLKKTKEPKKQKQSVKHPGVIHAHLRRARVARFCLDATFQNGKLPVYQMTTKYTKMVQNILNCHKNIPYCHKHSKLP
jgi:ribosomal protein S14